MYKVLVATFTLTLLVVTVASHGGHDEGFQTKNAIQDALLSYLCRGANGFPCNGHGSCSGGMCTCYRGYSGLKCKTNDVDMILSPVNEGTGVGNEGTGVGNDVGGINLHDLLSPSTDEQRVMSCVINDDNTCSGHGLCHEGVCLCEPGRSGLMCELSHKVGFCQTYKDCAECTAFMEPCPEQCAMLANFKLVFGFPKVTDGSSFRKCRFRNSERNCTFYFKQEMNEERMKTIMVKACLAYHESTTNTSETLEQLKDKPTQPDTSSQEATSSEDSHEGHTHTADENGKDSESWKQGSNRGDSGTSVARPEVFLIFGSLIMMLKF